jgi:antitoxin PrlF
MNAHSPITEASEINMTSKGQVLIPKALRDRSGLLPGARVRVGLNEQGQVVVIPSETPETDEDRRARIRAALENAVGSINLGMSTDEYMDLIRGPYADDQ